MRQELVGAHGTYGQEREADDDVREASRGNVEHQQEDGVEQHGRAQIAFEDDDEQAYAPDCEQRQQQAQARDLEAQDLAVGDGEQLAVLGQIACQEQDDKDLGELAGLNGKAGDANPQLRARDRGADKDGQHEQNDADDAKGVLVAHDHVEVFHQRKRAYHQGNRDKQNDELGDGKRGRQARHKRDTDARKHKDDGQDGRVGAGCQDAHGDVCRGKRGKEADRHGERLKRDGGARGEHVHRIQQDDGERRGDEQEHFGVAATHKAALPF